ncbi:hypothetical protein CCR94_19315, partial [Rhodoblastus sphagnicola]
MFTILDQWLARLFGASRRDRSVPLLAQRAYYGHDGMDFRQIDAYDRSFDFDDQPTPYQTYVRLPRSGDILIDSPAAPASAPAPGAQDLAEQEAAATLKSRRMLRGDWVEPETPATAEPAPAAPEVWSADPGRVRFTRTPETFIQRRRDEEEARARALEEETRRVAEETRLRAEAEARRIEEDTRRLEETKLAIAQAMRGVNQDADADAPRVRFARTPDAVFQARARLKDPKPDPIPEPEAEAEIGTGTGTGTEPETIAEPEAQAEVPPAPVAEPAPAFEQGAFGQVAALFTAMGARFALQTGSAASARFVAPLAPAVHVAPVPAPVAPAPVVSTPEPVAAAAAPVEAAAAATGSG